MNESECELLTEWKAQDRIKNRIVSVGIADFKHEYADNVSLDGRRLRWSHYQPKDNTDGSVIENAQLLVCSACIRICYGKISKNLA
jgi:hypothetical protein